MTQHVFLIKESEFLFHSTTRQNNGDIDLIIEFGNQPNIFFSDLKGDWKIFNFDVSFGGRMIIREEWTTSCS